MIDQSNKHDNKQAQTRADAIYQQGNLVFRPLNKWSKSVHDFLTFLHDNGFTKCPRFVKTENQKEVLTFVEGKVGNYPLKGEIASDKTLISAAKLLMAFHEVSAKYFKKLEAQSMLDKQHWMLPVQKSAQVICHGDFAPYNVAFNNQGVTGVFDFDTIHPAPKLWDVAYAIYCWAPFKTNEDDKLGELPQQIKRAKLFCDAYQLEQLSREQLVQMMIKRITALVDFMQQAANKDDAQFQENIEDGHLKWYLKDIEYLKNNEILITQGLS